MYVHARHTYIFILHLSCTMNGYLHIIVPKVNFHLETPSSLPQTNTTTMENEHPYVVNNGDNTSSTTSPPPVLTEYVMISYSQVLFILDIFFSFLFVSFPPYKAFFFFLTTHKIQRDRLIPTRFSSAGTASTHKPPGTSSVVPAEFNPFTSLDPTRKALVSMPDV